MVEWREGCGLFCSLNCPFEDIVSTILSPIEGHSIFNSTKKLCLLEVYCTAKFGQFHAVEENNS